MRWGGGGEGSWELARPTRHPHHGLALSVAWLLLAWKDCSSLSLSSVLVSFLSALSNCSRRELPTPSVSLPSPLFRVDLIRASHPSLCLSPSHSSPVVQRALRNLLETWNSTLCTYLSHQALRGTGIRGKSTIQGQLQTVPVLVWSRSVPS